MYMYVCMYSMYVSIVVTGLTIGGTAAFAGTDDFPL